MPTGYTADIANDISFKQFAMQCARAFGACVTMRDDPFDAEIPVFEPSDTYSKWCDEKRAELDVVMKMTDEEIIARQKADIEKIANDNIERTKKNEVLRIKYLGMLSDVHNWVPPSEDHEGLKKFMIEQIEESIKFDCQSYQNKIPDVIDPTEWRNGQVVEIKKDIARYAAMEVEEIERTNQRNRWVSQLKKSL